MWEVENFAVVRWSRQQMDPCVLGSPAYIKSLDFVPLGELRKEHSVKSISPIQENSM